MVIRWDNYQRESPYFYGNVFLWTTGPFIGSASTTEKDGEYIKTISGRGYKKHLIGRQGYSG